MSNIVIVGSGPAGVSAALYAVRAGVQTTVLTKGSGALARAEKIENYYGFAQPVSGPELERRSIENARRLGVQFVQTEAVGLTWTDRLTVETLAGAYPADAVILATGASRAVPRIPGLTGLEGHGVSWCAACDAFFYRGKDVAVLGSGEYALHEVQALLPVVKSVTLLTDGAALTADFPHRTACQLHAGDGLFAQNGFHLLGADGHLGRTDRHRRAAGRRCGAGGIRCVRGAGRGGQHRTCPEAGRCRRGQPHRGG